MRGRMTASRVALPEVLRTMTSAVACGRDVMTYHSKTAGWGSTRAAR
jgi:hypothetical protein